MKNRLKTKWPKRRHQIITADSEQRRLLRHRVFIGTIAVAYLCLAAVAMHWTARYYLGSLLLLACCHAAFLLSQAMRNESDISRKAGRKVQQRLPPSRTPKSGAGDRGSPSVMEFHRVNGASTRSLSAPFRAGIDRSDFAFGATTSSEPMCREPSQFQGGARENSFADRSSRNRRDKDCRLDGACRDIVQTVQAIFESRSNIAQFDARDSNRSWRIRHALPAGIPQDIHKRRLRTGRNLRVGRQSPGGPGGGAPA